MDPNTRRIGEISINSDLLLSEPGLMSRAFAEIEFVALKMETDPVYNAMIYTGYSKSFKEVAEGAEIPRYDFEFHKQEDGTILIELV